MTQPSREAGSDSPAAQVRPEQELFWLQFPICSLLGLRQSPCCVFFGPFEAN